MLEISEGRRRENENEKSAEAAGGTLHTEKVQFWPQSCTLLQNFQSGMLETGVKLDVGLMSKGQGREENLDSQAAVRLKKEWTNL